MENNKEDNSNSTDQHAATPRHNNQQVPYTYEEILDHGNKASMEEEKSLHPISPMQLQELTTTSLEDKKEEYMSNTPKEHIKGKHKDHSTNLRISNGTRG